MMKPLLYESNALQQGCGSHLRPGGSYLTKRIFELARPADTDRIIDVGCGRGTTLKMLYNQGFRQLFGLDRHQEFLGEADSKDVSCVCGDMTDLPFQDNSADLLLCECSWNLSEQTASLMEFARVIRPGGTLALADIFLHNNIQGEWPIESCLASARTMTETQEMIRRAGFDLECFDDQSHVLRQAAAQFVLAHGSLSQFWYAVTGSSVASDRLCSMTAASRPGLCIFIGRRNNG